MATLLLHLSGRLFTEPLERINAQEGPERWQTVLNSLYSSIVDVHCYIHRGVRHSGSARPPFSPRGSGSGFIAEAVGWGGGGERPLCPFKSDSADQPAASVPVLRGPFLPSPCHLLLHSPPPAHTHASMQYCSLQHRTLLLSPVTSTAGYCFCFGFIPSFFLELFLH